MKIALADKPFYTLQGEGVYLGRPCVFVRFWGCNLKCSWCDTKYSWQTTQDRVEYELEEVVEMIQKVHKTGAGIVFTGGEPCLFQKDMMRIVELASSVMKIGFINVETNGTVPLLKELYTTFNFHYTVSPKLKNSGNKYKRDFSSWNEKGLDFSLKFVITSNNDLEEAKEIISQFKNVKESKVFLMPEGETREEQIFSMEKVYYMCMKEGYTMCPRLHVLAFDKKREI